MPVTCPSTSELNRTPSSTELGSFALGLAGTAEDGQMVHAEQATDGLGVTGFDAADAGPVPPALVAVTWKVYAVPVVRQSRVVLVAGGVPVCVVAPWAVVPM